MLSSESTPNRYYVYAIYDSNDRPRYVGKGCRNRLEGNIRKSHNSRLAKIIAESGSGLASRKLIQEISESEAFELEKFLIAEIGRMPKGPLVNMTDGGDGVSGYKLTPAQLAAMSAARKGKPVSANARKVISEKLKGRSFSLAHRMAISAAKKGKSNGPLTESHRAAIGLAHIGRKRVGTALEALRNAAARMTDEARALKGRRISVALTGRSLSESHRASISCVQKGRVRSAEFRAKVKAGVLAFHNNGERDARIMKMRRAGMTARKIAIEVGMTEAAIWSVLHRRSHPI